MPTESAGAVVFSADRTRVLLVKREDFRIWTLPGGGVEPGESWEGAAIRETFEETGYRVAIDRLIGRYWRPQAPRGGDVQHLFEAHIVGGAPISSGPETAAVDFFPTNQLPPRMSPFVEPLVADALANSTAVIERKLFMPIWLMILLRIGLVVRDLRNRAFRSGNEPNDFR